MIQKDQKSDYVDENPISGCAVTDCGIRYWWDNGRTMYTGAGVADSDTGISENMLDQHSRIRRNYHVLIMWK